MDMKAVVREHLVKEGADGLCGKSCACLLKDVVKCKLIHQLEKCSPGWLIATPDNPLQFVMAAVKPIRGDEK